MGWLGNSLTKLVTDIAGAPPLQLTFVPSVPAPSVPGIGEAIEPDSCYIELWLESLRLTRGRKFATRFHGIAYSFVELPREGMESARLTAISKPDKLADIDPKAPDRVITVSKRMMGATAFRGNPLSLQFGLFSVKDGDLLTPVLNYLTSVSSTAGISYVGAIKPFLPLIEQGMDLLTGQTSDTALEVGVDTGLTLANGCAAAIIAQPKGSVNTAKLSVDTDGSLLLDGKLIDCGYAVFSLRPKTQNPEYGGIPELKERYAAFLSAIRGGKAAEAQDALTAFRLAVVASPDLIPSDARTLIEKAEGKFKDAFPPAGGTGFGLRAAKAGKRAARPGPDETLSDIGLYK